MRFHQPFWLVKIVKYCSTGLKTKLKVISDESQKQVKRRETKTKTVIRSDRKKISSNG